MSPGDQPIPIDSYDTPYLPCDSPYLHYYTPYRPYDTPYDTTYNKPSDAN